MSRLLLLHLLSASLDPCPAALKAAPAYTVCVAAGPGVALSTRQDEAAELADIAQDAQTRFAEYFPTKPGLTALFFASDVAPVEALKSAGFASVLPWASPDQIATLVIESSLQRAAAKAGKPMPEDILVAARAKLPVVSQKVRADQRDVIAHELGHQWYEAIYWQGRPTPAGGYGTVAPDWIEETAAILMEGPVVSDARRATFHRVWSAAGAAGRAEPQAIGDLAYFLNRQHPSAGKVGTNARGVTVSVTDGTNGPFYDQARLFADYLLDKTKDPLVFDNLSRFLAGGGTAEGWFAEQTRYPMLPRLISAVQRDWSAWIEARNAEN